MQDIPPEQSLIEYPSQFPIKVMGLNVDGYVHAITRIAEQFDPAFDATTVDPGGPLPCVVFKDTCPGVQGLIS